MKRYIKSTTEISDATLQQAVAMVKSNRQAVVDLANHSIIVPCSSGVTEEDLMSEGMMGRWFEDHGFDVSFSTGDFEYTTKDQFNPRSMSRSSGHKSYLRNRLIMKITW